MAAGKETRVLVIGDLHAPFILNGYLDFVVDVAKKIKPTMVIQIGDVLDHHAISRHETHPEADGAVTELKKAIQQLQPFYKAFPRVVITRGNHDMRVAKQAASVKIPSTYLKELLDVIEAPKHWVVVDNIVVSGVRYLHGTGKSGDNHAINIAKGFGQSVVAGHIHTNLGVKYHTTPNGVIFGMNVGCGVDSNTYGMAYASEMVNKSSIGCGYVINGHSAVAVPFQ